MKTGTAVSAVPVVLVSNCCDTGTKNNIRAFIVSVRIFFRKERVAGGMFIRTSW